MKIMGGPVVIGLTGGIGAGKSYVSRILRCRGFEVYDCDSEARRIMESSVSLKREIAEKLGSHCLDESGSVNRANVAEAVFADKMLLQWLNGLVHALVRDDIQERIGRLSSGGILIVESAILYSSGLAEICDAIWLVDAPLALRVERASGRDGTESDRIMARVRAQQLEFDGCKPDALIVNDGSRPLLAQIDAAIDALPKRL